MNTTDGGDPDLGDVVIVLLGGSLAGLRDRLAGEGYKAAAELLADLVEMIDDYAFGLAPRRPRGSESSR
jgi:hypothetical protein